MKIKLGDTVQSDYGPGKVVAISKEWCIHEDEKGTETCSFWDEVWLEIEPPNKCESLITEKKT